MSGNLLCTENEGHVERREYHSSSCITAFLAQDILTEEYSEFQDQTEAITATTYVFDLTSEHKALSFLPEQFRDVHFAQRALQLPEFTAGKYYTPNLVLWTIFLPVE